MNAVAMLVFVGCLCGPAWPQNAAGGEELARGRFLVASRGLGDPNFAEAVVLLLDYAEDGSATGLIVNRRTDLPLSRVFRDLKDASQRTDTAYIGGPVELNSVLALIKSATKPEHARQIVGDIYLISSKELLQKTLESRTGPEAFHVYLGYAGWEAGQLEHEIDLGAWRVLPASAAEVFHSDPESVWPRLIRRTETQVARVGHWLRSH